MERDVDLLCQTLVEAPEEGAAAGKEDTLLDDVAVELRRSLLQDGKDCLLDADERLVEAVRDLLRGDSSLDRVDRHKVRAADDAGLEGFVEVGNSCADFDLDALRRNFTHLDVVLLAHILLDVIGEDITGGLDALVGHDASEGDDGHFCGTASDIDYHTAGRCGDVNADSEGSRHRLEDEGHVAATGTLSGVADGADLHRRGTGRDADHHLEAGGEEALLVVDHSDEAADHHLCGVEVGDHAVLEGTDGADVRAGTLVHLLCLASDGDKFVGEFIYCDDGGLVNHLLVVHKDDGVGGSKVYSEVLGKKIECHLR